MLTNTTTPGAAETLRRAGRKYSGLEQCRAVLLVWSERRSATDVCRELKISSGLLTLWQERALEGVLTALEPREGRAAEHSGPALSSRLKKLLEKKAGEREGRARLARRLQATAGAKAQEGREG